MSAVGPTNDPTPALQRLVESQEGGTGLRLRQRDGRTWVSIRNEFAMVEVSLEADANGPRVLIRDPESDTVILLDPLELEALTRLRHDHFGPLILQR